MLLDDFYSVRELADHPQEGGGMITATLDIHKSHSIFDGHFPGLPVVPGVCMMQMIKEIVEHRLEKKFMLRSADQVKFLAVITPDVHPTIMTEIQFQSSSEREIEIAARLYYGTVTFFKLKASLSSISQSGFR